MKNFISIFFIFLSIIIFADNKDLLPVGSREVGMGGCSVVNVGLWSISNNQAGLGFVKNVKFGIHYENRFNVSGVGYKAFAGALPTNSGTFGVKVNYFGYSNYNDIEAGIAYGKSFGERFSAGIQLNYLRTYIAHDYGTNRIALAEIGILSEPIDNLFIGAHLYNITRAKYANTINGEAIPSIFKLGVGYNFSDDAFLTAEIDKNIDYPMVFRAGIEFKVVNNFVVRTGVATNSTLLSLGMGYKNKGLSIDLAFSYHQYLGYSPFITMSYSFGE
jgi:hypothetical protein